MLKFNMKNYYRQGLELCKVARIKKNSANVDWDVPFAVGNL